MEFDRMRYLATVPVVRALVLIALGCIASMVLSARADAQNVPAELTAIWTLPTHTECVAPPPQGSDQCVRLPLTEQYAMTGVQLFISQSPIADNSTMAPTVTLPPGTTTYDYTATVPNGTTLYVRTKAVNQFGASPTFSNQDSKLVLVPAKPMAPSNVTVTLTIALP